MALTTNLLRRRLHIRPSLHRNFSSSDNPSNDGVSSQRNSSFSSYFSDVKASLSKQAPPSQPYMKRPFSPSSNPNPPPKISSLGEIRKSLSEFRRVSAPPPPSPSSHISFQELYKRNVVPKSGEEARKVDQFDAIRESLSNLKSKNEGTIGSRRLNGLTSNPFSLSLKGNIDPKTLMGEGGQSLPLHIFGKEVGGKDGKVVGEGLGGVADKFVRSYNYDDLGKKLMNLRPEKKKDERNWFSLQELSERLHKLRVNDEKEMETGLKSYYKDIRATLMQTDKSDKEKRTNANVLRIDMLNNLGAEQDFMLSPPKEHLVEKYFHPDNMSSAEKLKIELKKVRDEFKMSESDCGSARVQVAQLTTKIKHLSTALHKKDKHSRKGLQAMVQRRKKLLKYLRRTDWDSYCLVLSKLGLRDNPDYKN